MVAAVIIIMIVNVIVYHVPATGCESVPSLVEGAASHRPCVGTKHHNPCHSTKCGPKNKEKAITNIMIYLTLMELIIFWNSKYIILLT